MSNTTPLRSPVSPRSGPARRAASVPRSRSARRGTKVVVHYRSRDTEANQTVDAIREMGAAAVAIGGDLIDLDVVRTLFARTIDRFGDVNILVPNAGATFD